MQRSCSRPWNCFWLNWTPDRPRDVRDGAGHQCSAVIIPRPPDRSSFSAGLISPSLSRVAVPASGGLFGRLGCREHRLIRNGYERSECLDRVGTKRCVRRRRRIVTRERPPDRASGRIGLDFHHRFALRHPKTTEPALPIRTVCGTGVCSEQSQRRRRRPSTKRSADGAASPASPSSDRRWTHRIHGLARVSI